MKPRTKGQLPPSWQNLASLPSTLCNFGAASVSVLTDVGPAKIPEECPGKDLRGRYLLYLLAVHKGLSTGAGLQFCCSVIEIIWRGFHVLLSLHSRLGQLADSLETRVWRRTLSSTVFASCP